MAKSNLPDPRADAATELDRVRADREKQIPQMEQRIETTDAKLKATRAAYDQASRDAMSARRSLSSFKYQLHTRETAARAALVATADPRIAEFIDEVQYMVSTRRNEFFGATPEGMQRWTLAIQRACDEARTLQCSPSDDGKTTALLVKWREDIAAAERRIAERSGEPVSIGEELSKAVQSAPTVQRTKAKHGERYKEID